MKCHQAPLRECSNPASCGPRYCQLDVVPSQEVPRVYAQGDCGSSYPTSAGTQKRCTKPAGHAEAEHGHWTEELPVSPRFRPFGDFVIFEESVPHYESPYETMASGGYFDKIDKLRAVQEALREEVLHIQATHARLQADVAALELRAKIDREELRFYANLVVVLFIGAFVVTMLALFGWL